MGESILSTIVALPIFIYLFFIFSIYFFVFTFNLFFVFGFYVSFFSFVLQLLYKINIICYNVFELYKKEFYNYGKINFRSNERKR